MHNYTDEIVVQKKVIKYIVGKAGASINRFKEQFDVRIEIEPDKTEAIIPFFFQLIIIIIIIIRIIIINFLLRKLKKLHHNLKLKKNPSLKDLKKLKKMIKKEKKEKKIKKKQELQKLQFKD